MVALGFFTASVVATVRNRDGLPYQLAAVMVLLVLLGFQLLHAGPWRHRRPWRPWWPWSLLAHGVITYLPFLVFDGAWVGLPGSFAGSVLLTVAAPRSWILFTLLVAGQYPVYAALGDNAGQCLNASVSTAAGGIVVYGVARLADMTAELRAARTELAERAVDQERLRFSRDLHDLLGYSLSVAALKCQIAERTVLEDPPRARAEIYEVLTMVRQAMSDTRWISSGDLQMSLARETRFAASALRAAGISVEVDLAYGTLPPEHDAVLATVAREAVTNMLRHSAARRCEIRAVRGELGDVSLVVSNDGVLAEGVPAEPGGGRGIGNLTERLLAVGGRLTAEEGETGWFHLSAVIAAPQTRTTSRAG
ncbi:sensor histidine kinase [Kitasatospora sp. NPDC057940]|uniref:sensor histidine kinase n=1 Tax=Kitasatospora sp. NPDC057940 TaxID=3346285 RepID=UPI0036DDA1E5